jgi:hypothetical protein
MIPSALNTSFPFLQPPALVTYDLRSQTPVLPSFSSKPPAPPLSALPMYPISPCLKAPSPSTHLPAKSLAPTPNGKILSSIPYQLPPKNGVAIFVLGSIPISRDTELPTMGRGKTGRRRGVEVCCPDMSSLVQRRRL